MNRTIAGSRADQAVEPGGGLSSIEAANRLKDEGPNGFPGRSHRSFGRIAAGILFEPMFSLLLAAASVYLVLGDRNEGLFLLGSVGAVIALALFQERRSQRALEALRGLTAPRALVLRDGVPVRIPSVDVVRGDLLVLSEGDRVAADARLLDGVLGIDESLLTGEAGTVLYRPCRDSGSADDAGPRAGTLITTGHGTAEVLSTGSRTQLGRLGLALASAREEPTPLQRESRRIVRVLAVGAIAAAALLALLAWIVGGHTLVNGVLMGLALALALVPEEIPMVLTVFLAIGAWRLGTRKVLVRRAEAVEAIGGITVLAVDKTGTLTANQMALAALRAGSSEWNGGALDANPSLETLLRTARMACPPEPVDPMDRAIRRLAKGAAMPGTEDGPAAHEYPMSADLLAVVRAYATGADYMLAAKGAPEAVIQLCRLGRDAAAAVLAETSSLAQQGLRVLAVARASWTGAPPWPPSPRGFAFEFVGLLGFADPLRPEVPAAMQACREAGIRVIVMTGDHPDTALAIAAAAGLPVGRLLSGAEVEAMDDSQLREALPGTQVCARVLPHHKLRVVRALQAGGARVAMTGDGVNDAPALAEADVGIAMGARGSDVAREAADLVLLDDSFASIVEAIRQARRVRLNLHRAMRFVFAVHIPIVALALVPVIWHWPILLLPAHVVLLELLIDPVCSILFEAEPPPADVMRRGPAALASSPFSMDNLARGLAQGVGAAFVLVVAAAVLVAGERTESLVRGATFLALVVTAALLAHAQREWKTAPGGAGNPWIRRLHGALGLFVLAVLASAELRGVLGMEQLTAAMAAAVLAVAVAGAVLAWLALLHRTLG